MAFDPRIALYDDFQYGGMRETEKFPEGFF